MKDNVLHTYPVPRLKSPDAAIPEEALVTDDRAGLSPAQMVDRKLVSLLQSMPLHVGRLPTAAPRRGLS